MTFTPARHHVGAAVVAALVAGGSLVAVSPALAAVGDIYYVSATGSDVGTGAVSDPFLTIQHAVDVAVDGDTIDVGEGTFAGFGSTESLTIEGANAGTASEEWAGDITPTLVSGTVTLSGPSTLDGLEFGSTLSLHPGAEGALIADNVFDTADQQIWLNSLDADEATTTFEYNTFLQFQPTGQVNAIESSSAGGLLIRGNTFYGDYTSTDSVAVNLIGGSIEDVVVQDNTSHGLANFVVANGNDATGITGLTVAGNSIYDSTQTSVYIGDNVDEVSITDNLFADGNSSGISFTYYTPTAALGGSGPDLAVHGNTFVGNVRGINVASGAITTTLNATGNIFYGNDAAVLNASTQTVDAAGSWWSIPAGPLTIGKDALTGSGATTFAPVASVASSFTGATAVTTGLTTAVHLGAAWKNTEFVIGGLGAPDTFAFVTTDNAGDATVVWPAGTVSGTQKIAVYKDAPGGPQSVTTTIPAPATYTATPVPGVSGHTTVGATLTAITRTWAPAGFTLALQWNANGVAIPAASGSQLLLTPALAGKKISLTVTATRSGEAAIARTSPQTAAVALGALTSVVPVISGSRTVGATLTANPGLWGPATVTVGLTYRWYRNGVLIAGQTGATYKQASADLGKRIQVRVTGTSAGYGSLAVTSVSPPHTTARLVSMPTSVSIGSAAVVGTKLSITTTGAYQAGSKLTYLWRANGVIIKGAKSSTYVPLPADKDKTITVTVFAARTGYTTARISSPATAAVIAGMFTTTPAPVVAIAQVGYPASVTLGTWAPKPTSYSYQWKLDGSDVVGATKATYTPPGTALGQTLSVRVTAVRSGFTSSFMVSAGKVVAVGIFADTVKPKITGTARVGRILTATTKSWSPAAQFAYQWNLNGTPIAGAIDNIYTVSSEDLGGRLSVTVTGARAGFSSGVETSNPTAAVAP